MDLSHIAPPKGAKKNRKRVGRGSGSGHGKTSCRGEKGQKARSGGGKGRGFEGGQMPLKRRQPKRGFTNPFKKDWQWVNLLSLNAFDDGQVVDPQGVLEKGLIKKMGHGLKVLAKGTLRKKLTVKAHAFSKRAKEAIEQAGGEALILKREP